MQNTEYRLALKKVIIVHLIMFAASFIAAITSNSSSVLADSLDFIGDAASYFISFYVLGKSQLIQAIVAIFKGFSMLAFGIPVLIYAIIRLGDGTVPTFEIMGITGAVSVIAHIYCIKVLYSFRDGNSNRLSVWICTINDLICNILTIIAALLVLYTGSIIPDITVAAIIVLIALLGAFVILKQAIKELKQHRRPNI